jgi:hypothetical protein
MENSTENPIQTSSSNSLTFKSRGDLLREKVNNLSDYLIKLSPDQRVEIEKFRAMSNEDIVIYIVNYILPNRFSLGQYVDQLMCYYKVEVDLQHHEEVKDKLIRYCQFFIKFLQNG